MKKHPRDSVVEYTCTMRPDGIVSLGLRGNIDESTVDELAKWGKLVKKTLREVHKKTPDRVLTIMDCTHVDKVSVHCSGELHKLLRHNKQYVTRTAIFGANTFSQAVLEMSIYITGRTNMKLFKTKRAALAWLREADTNKNK